MNSIKAKYFERAKRILVRGEGWTLTARSASKGHLSNTLRKHGFRLREARWDKLSAGLYAAELVRR